MSSGLHSVAVENRRASRIAGLLVLVSLLVPSVILRAGEAPEVCFSIEKRGKNSSSLIVTHVGDTRTAKLHGSWPGFAWGYITSEDGRYIAVFQQNALAIYKADSIIDDIQRGTAFRKLYITTWPFRNVKEKAVEDKVVTFDYLDVVWKDVSRLRVIAHIEKTPVERYDYEVTTGEMSSVDGKGRQSFCSDKGYVPVKNRD